MTILACALAVAVETAAAAAVLFVVGLVDLNFCRPSSIEERAVYFE